MNATNTLSRRGSQTGLKAEEAAEPKAAADDWLRMYRHGIGAAGIARLCDVDDIMAVLKCLADARRADPLLETEHTSNLLRHARDAEEEVTGRKILTPAWQARINDLEAFVRDHGRMPRQAGGDRAETSLGRWLHAQRAKVSNGVLHPRLREALDAVGDWDSDRRARRDAMKFPARLAALTAYAARHRRLPVRRQGTDTYELALATWLFSLRQAAETGQLDPRQRAALDKALPGWRV